MLVCSSASIEVMRIIAFATQKGGTGKSTLACNLAVAAMQSGEKPLALDLDAQGTLTGWARLRPDSLPPIPVASLAAETHRLGEVLKSAAGQYTTALLDLPGRDSPLAHNAMVLADLCLVPMRPTRADGLAVRQTVETLIAGRKHFAFVLNQCPAHLSRSLEMAAGLTALGMLADPMICLRAAFQDAYAAGQGVTEYEPQGKAADEIRRLWQWVTNDQATERARYRQPHREEAVAG
jgi:chromosome partitioning protein